MAANRDADSAFFVGRQEENLRLAAGLREALAGRGQLMLLTGEPGIGKTRLADEAAATAAAQGVPVLWGRCWESGGAPAYWPWLEPLQSLADRLDDVALRDALGDGSGLVAELVPPLRPRLGDSAAMATPVLPDEARFRLWRSVAGLVRRACEPAGVVLVLDDLHAADHASLLLLLFLARELRSMRLLLIGTHRDVEARLDAEASALLSRVAREGGTLTLKRLDRTATGAFVRQRAVSLATNITPDIEQRIFERTQGNPLFIEEMARLLGDDADAVVAGLLPDSVRDVIRQRLDRVPEAATALLQLAAVAGDQLDVDLLAAASGQEASVVTSALVAAARTGALADRGGRWRFSHALVREVLSRDLSPERRRALHGAVADALVARFGRSDVAPLAEMAFHALAGPAAQLPRAVDLAVRASTQASERLAYEEAVAVLTRAAAAVDAAGGPPALRAIVSLALAAASLRRGDTAGGKTLCREVAALARQLGDPALLANAALTYGQVFTFAVVDPVMVSLLEEALESLPPGDSLLRVRLLARLGGALQPARRTEEPARVAREAIAAARRLGDRAALSDALYAGLSAMMDVVDPRERMPLNLEVEQLATAAGDRERLLRTHGRLVIDHLELGQLVDADARIEAFEALAQELNAPWIGWRAPLFRALRATMHGRFAEAQRLGETALQQGRGARDPQVDRCMTLHREGFLRAAERHDEMLVFDAAVRREKAAVFLGPAWQSMGSAMVATRREDETSARQHLELLPDDMRPPVDNVFSLFYLAEPVAFVGPSDLAERLFALMLPAAERDVMLGMTQMSWEGPVARVLALLAERLRRWDSASGYFEAAIDRAQKMKAYPILARTRYEYARALLKRGDAARARPLLVAAQGAAQQLDLPGLARLIEARLAALAPSSAAPSARPASTVSATVPGAPTAPPFSMVDEGEYWALHHEGETFRLKDSLGLRYLARLVAEPDREIHVLDLIGQRGGDGSHATADVIDTGDAGELLDSEARESYRRRVDDLRDSLAEAESFGDAARAARAHEELEFLAGELGRAVGLGGRSRRAGSAAERARSAVQRRIKNALQRIDQSAPALAAYLTRTLRTGNFCVFRPRAG